LLLGHIKLSCCVTLIVTLANTVDLVVARSTVMVSVLTSTGNSPLDVGRMPCTNTGNLSETLVCLSGKLLGSPSAGDTRETVTLGNSNDIDHLVLLEDGTNLNWLLEEAVGEVDLLGNAASVDLDLHQVSLLLLERGLADLGVGENTDDCAILLDTLELTGDRGAGVLGMLLGILGEGLLLALIPVLIEPTLNLVAQVFSPNGGERSKTPWGLDITN
jgi:hypothetical protein